MGTARIWINPSAKTWGAACPTLCPHNLPEGDSALPSSGQVPVGRTVVGADFEVLLWVGRLVAISTGHGRSCQIPRKPVACVHRPTSILLAAVGVQVVSSPTVEVAEIPFALQDTDVPVVALLPEEIRNGLPRQPVRRGAAHE